MEEAEIDKQNLALVVLEHLTNPEVFCYPVRNTNLCACLRAIEYAEHHKLHWAIKLPNGLVKTAGQVIEMFRLGQFVDWEKASHQKMNYDDMARLGIQEERRKLHGPKVEIHYNRRRSPKVGHE